MMPTQDKPAFCAPLVQFGKHAAMPMPSVIMDLLELEFASDVRQVALKVVDEVIAHYLARASPWKKSKTRTQRRKGPLPPHREPHKAGGAARGQSPDDIPVPSLPKSHPPPKKRPRADAAGGDARRCAPRPRTSTALKAARATRDIDKRSGQHRIA